MIKILLVIATISALLLLGIWSISTKERLAAKEKALQKTMKEMTECYENINKLTPVEPIVRVVMISSYLTRQERKAARLALQIQRLKTKLEKQ